MSSIQRQRNFGRELGEDSLKESLKDELNKLYGDAPSTPIDVHIQSSQRSSKLRKGSKGSKVKYPLATSELSGSNPLNESSLHSGGEDGSTVVGEREIAPISEEQTQKSNAIQIQDEQQQQVPQVSIDPYSEDYTQDSNDPPSKNVTIATGRADSQVESQQIGKLEVAKN